MDEFEITLEELEQLCTELGLEITKYHSNSFTNVYVRLPESEIWDKNVIDARGVISGTLINTSDPNFIVSSSEYNNIVVELFFTFMGSYKRGYYLASNYNNPYYGLKNAADLKNKLKWLMKKFKDKQVHYKLKHLEKDFM